MMDDLYRQLETGRNALLRHQVFSDIRTLEDVRRFMEIHVYAVWDFMSLLKRLQIDLTCVRVPWVPALDTGAARLINEIVIGEESDEAPQGGFLSHLELYLRAMEEVGAETGRFRRFLHLVGQGEMVPLALARCDVPEAARAFVLETMQVVQHGATEEVLAYFFFGREDVIPDMFARLLRAWSVSEASVPTLAWYLRRHIELDGDTHGPAARRIVAALVRDAGQRARLADGARSAIAARMRLWDGLRQSLHARGAILT